MTNSYTGIYLPVYANMLTKYGDDVVRTAITKTTSNIEGDETLTGGSTSTLRAYLSHRVRPWFVDKAGLIEGGDAVMIVKSTDTVNKDDLITHNNITYRVQSIIARTQPGGNTAFYTAQLFKI
jgi:hypothetical protein